MSRSGSTPGTVPGTFAIPAAWVACATLFALVFARSSNQLLTGDEFEFYFAASNWRNWRQTIPHPHLYLHYIQLLFGLFGTSPEIMRLGSLLANLATLALIPWAVRLTTPAHMRTATGNLAMLLFAISPFVLQNALLIDIDNSVLTTACLLHICCWWQLRAHRSAMLRCAVCACVFAMALWFKLLTPVMVILALLVFHARTKDWRAIGEVLAHGIAGCLLFAALHTIYGTFTGYTLLDATAAFRWDRSGGMGLAALVASIAPQAAGLLLFWVALPMFAIWAGLWWGTARRYLGGRLETLDGGMIFVLGVMVFYTLALVPPYAYPRYHAVTLPFMAIGVARLLAPHVQVPGGLRWLALLAGLSAIYVLAVLGDPLYLIYRATFETTSIRERVTAGGSALLLQAPLIALAVVAAVALRKSRALSIALALPLAAVAAGMHLATDWLQANAPYSTRYRYTYNYADRITAQNMLATNTPANSFLLADKDMLWSLPREGELVYGYLLDGPLLKETVMARRVGGLSWTNKEWIKAPLRQDGATLAFLHQCYDWHTYGEATVLVRSFQRECPIPK